MAAEFQLRLKCSVAAAAILSLWGVVGYFGFEAEYQEQNRDPYRIGALPARFERVLSSTPENAILGYITDMEPGSVLATAMFNGAQYVLAPRILQQGPDPDWVLGNFSRPADFAGAGRSHGLRIERDFGQGVVLFRKESRK